LKQTKANTLLNFTDASAAPINFDILSSVRDGIRPALRGRATFLTISLAYLPSPLQTYTFVSHEDGLFFLLFFFFLDNG